MDGDAFYNDMRIKSGLGTSEVSRSMVCPKVMVGINLEWLLEMHMGSTSSWDMLGMEFQIKTAEVQ